MQPSFDFDPNECVVLVVDDNAVNRKLLGWMLSHYKLEFLQACDGKEAIDVVKKTRNVTGNPTDPQIGLVWMDLDMPIMDGLEATAYIRNELGLTSLPVIALTACALDEDKEKALQSGVTEFQAKPIKRDTVHSKCQFYLCGEERQS